jgi:hypothetical protein
MMLKCFQAVELVAAILVIGEAAMPAEALTMQKTPASMPRVEVAILGDPVQV